MRLGAGAALGWGFPRGLRCGRFFGRTIGSAASVRRMKRVCPLFGVRAGGVGVALMIAAKAGPAEVELRDGEKFG